MQRPTSLFLLMAMHSSWVRAVFQEGTHLKTFLFLPKESVSAGLASEFIPGEEISWYAWNQFRYRSVPRSSVTIGEPASPEVTSTFFGSSVYRRNSELPGCRLCTWKQLAPAQLDLSSSCVGAPRVTSRARGSIFGVMVSHWQGSPVEKRARLSVLAPGPRPSACPLAFRLVLPLPGGWGGEWAGSTPPSSWLRQAGPVSGPEVHRQGPGHPGRGESAWAETIPYGEPGKGASGGVLYPRASLKRPTGEAWGGGLAPACLWATDS